MAYPKVQIVASPDPGATVLYDFNVDPTRKVGRDGFDAGYPEWRGEPGTVGGVDDYRTIQFTHLIDAVDDTTARANLIKLGQLLLADKGWLLIQQRASSNPRWARIWRSSPGALSWDRVQIRTTTGSGAAKGKYAFDLALEADPFLQEASVTLASGTITNDPASGSFQLALPDVLGDAPAPAIVTMTPSARADGALHLLQCAPVLAAGTGAPIVWQVGTGDGWSVSAMAAATADADWSGGSYRQTTGAAASVGGSKTVQPGHYRAFVRAGAPAAATGVWRFGFYSSPLSAPVVSESWQIVAGSADEAQWHPVGIVTFPLGAALADSVLAVEPAITVTVAMTIDRISGTGNLNVDAIVLLPVSDEATSLRWAVFCNVADTSITNDIVDGDQQIIYSRDPGDSKLKTRPPVAMGGFPVLQPGPNVMHILGALVGGKADGDGVLATVPSRVDLITVTTAVIVTYRPRYLWPAA